jgi:hypothetical protein
MGEVTENNNEIAIFGNDGKIGGGQGAGLGIRHLN